MSFISLQISRQKWIKSKINKYKINNNNKATRKHEFIVKYERYKQGISKDTLQMQILKKKCEKNPYFCENMSL